MWTRNSAVLILSGSDISRCFENAWNSENRVSTASKLDKTIVMITKRISIVISYRINQSTQLSYRFNQSYNGNPIYFFWITWRPGWLWPGWLWRRRLRWCQHKRHLGISLGFLRACAAGARCVFKVPTSDLSVERGDQHVLPELWRCATELIRWFF